jgi:hypothetical protein
MSESGGDAFQWVQVPPGERSSRSSYEPVQTQFEATVDLMPVTGLIGTAELEVEAEHTALWFGVYGCWST